jgi:hypothetical protein
MVPTTLAWRRSEASASWSRSESSAWRRSEAPVSWRRSEAPTWRRTRSRERAEEEHGPNGTGVEEE